MKALLIWIKADQSKLGDYMLERFDYILEFHVSQNSNTFV